MQILAFECSAAAASCALLRDDVLVAESFVHVRQTHSVTLLPMAQQMLASASVTPAEIDYFAVAAGPGSFTGLRIGIAAVKGMAFALDRPCIPVSTLEAMAYNLRGAAGVACCAMDARCGQVYNALFALTPDGGVRRLCADRAIPLSDLAAELKKFENPVFLLGDGAQLCYNYSLESAGSILLAPPERRFQRAASVAALAAERTDAAVSCGALAPGYLRLPQAERELLEKKQKGDQ